VPRSVLTRLLDRIFTGLLLVAVGLVLVRRAIPLTKGERNLTARSEREFFAWSYRDPSIHRRLAEVAPWLRGEKEICIQLALEGADPQWILAMARYYFPEQHVLSVRDASEPGTCPGTRVVLRAKAPAVIIPGANRNR
jgi:hypothetical protein